MHWAQKIIWSSECIYLGEGGGPILQSHFLDVMKLGTDEVLMVPYKCCYFFLPDCGHGP